MIKICRMGIRKIQPSNTYHTIHGITPIYMEANSVVHPITGAVEEYRHLIKGKDKLIWERSFSNKLGQLAQDTRDVNSTNTMTAIPKADIPKNKKGHI